MAKGTANGGGCDNKLFLKGVKLLEEESLFEQDGNNKQLQESHDMIGFFFFLPKLKCKATGSHYEVLKSFEQ